MQAPCSIASLAPGFRLARRLGGIAAIGLVSALSACDDDSSSPPTSKEVDFQLTANVGGGPAGRSVAVRAFYVRNGTEEVELEVDPTTLTVGEGASASKVVTVEVLPCLTDRNRESVAGNANGCRVHFALTLRAANGAMISKNEATATITMASSTTTVESVTLPSGALVVSVVTLDLAVTDDGQLPATSTVTISSSTTQPTGTLSSTIQYVSGNGWLSATIPAGQSTVSIVPTTTALAPGRYEAVVRVASAWMFTPVDIRVAYVVPQPPKYVTITGAGNGTGLILVTPSGASCTSTAGQLSGICTVPSPHGSTIELTPAPAVGSAFTGWSGACQGSGSCVLQTIENRAVTATFTILKRDLAVDAAGAGSGSIASSPSGITCTATGGEESGTCTAQYDHATQVTLTATPVSATSIFTGWSGACTGTGACVVTMTDARTVTATFSPIQRQLAVGTSGGGTGTVTSSPAGIDCTVTKGEQTGTCAASFSHGTTVVLTATPGTSMTFGGWTGACTGTETCSITMDQSRSVTATFTPPMVALTMTLTGNGRGGVTFTPGAAACGYEYGGSDYRGEGTYEPRTCVRQFPVGTVVELRALTDYMFGSASIGCPTGGGDFCRVVVNGPMTMQASFRVPYARVAVVGGGTGSGTVNFSGGGQCTVTAGQMNGECWRYIIMTTGTIGTKIEFNATPAAGSIFAGFLGCPAFGLAGSCVVNYGNDITVTAVFNPAPPDP